MATINAYLNFNGTCEEAFSFYKSCFGGEFAMVQRYKDMPEEVKSAMPVTDDEREQIMHMSLPVGPSSVLMGSDTPKSMGGVLVGTNLSVSVDVESKEEAQKLFDALSAGGVVTMPLDKTFWNAYFGMCADKFGVQWMVNCSYAPPDQQGIK